MDQETVRLHERIDALLRDADDYFSGVESVLGDVARSDRWFPRDEPDYFWSRLPEAECRKAAVLTTDVLRLGGEVATLSKVSPLITDADQRDLSIAVKTMRACLRLRRYTSWEAEVLHDEGTVLGVQRAGQADDQAYTPESARKTFAASHSRVIDVLEIVSSHETDRGLTPLANSSVPTTRIRQNTAFIMMWMDKAHRDLDDVSDGIKNVCAAFGIRAVRADDIEHEGVITDRIRNEIATSEFLVADLTGARPSVYYEVGYAHALGKRVILFRKKDTQLHFDLAGYNCPEYENLRDLRGKLTKRLTQMTNKEPTGRQQQ